MENHGLSYGLSTNLLHCSKGENGKLRKTDNEKGYNNVYLLHLFLLSLSVLY